MFDTTQQNHPTQTPHVPIHEHIPLADKTWFKTGGKARFYCEPTTAHEFSQALHFAHEHHLEIFILGKGANILISDDGFAGLVICPKIDTLSIIDFDNTHSHVVAGAGASFDALIEYCLAHNLLNLEEFSGIPGTVGGAVFINIHYYEFLLSHFLVSATVIHKHTGELQTVNNSWFNFGYNQSTIQTSDYYVVDATFKLRKANQLQAAHAKGRSEEIIRHRTRRYPSQGTCGSFFRNFTPQEVMHTDKKLIYVAYYLDKIGVKGELAINDAVVSYQHANMLVNQGNATSTDIVQLAQTMQELVHKEFGIKPQPECQLIGFNPNPLLG